MVATLLSSDKLPGGSWGRGPISLTWDQNTQGGVDVKVSVLGVNIDTLSGSLNSNGASLSDQIDILGIVTGMLGVRVVLGQGAAQDGLWITGQLTAFGHTMGPFDKRIIPL